MKHALVKLLLDNKFYEKHRHLLVREMFPDFLALFYTAIVAAHGRYKRPINIDELQELVYSANPMLTEAQRGLIHELALRIEQETNIGPDVAADVLQAAWREETGRQISKAGLDLIEGKGSILEIKRIVDKVGESCVPDENIQPITTDVLEVLAALDKRTAWRFNIPALNERCPGISEGEFGVFFARVETGKTAFGISTACAPDGFCWQGARVMYLGNEEPAIRTMLRCISAASGLTKEEVRENPKAASAEWDKIRNRLMVIDDITMTVERLNNVVKQKRPDILIVDQLDKVKISGNFMRTDQELGAVYSYMREIAKINHCAVLGATQADNTAEGKMVLHQNMMAESKTSKPAECDLIIGIGKVQEPIDDPMRYLTLCKNKISGNHGTANCMLRPELSRYVS